MDGIFYLGLFVAFVGLLVGAWSLRAHRRAKTQVESAKSWARSPGRILASRVEMRQAGTGRGSYAYYVPLVSYTYAAAGREREGTRLRFGMPTFRSSAGAEAALASYPQDAEVEVRYDPNAPDESVLDPSTVGSSLKIGFVLSGIVLVVGATIAAIAAGGLLSADLDGRWAAHFASEGVDYSGELVLDRREGTLNVDYVDSQGRHVVREHCSARRDGQDVHVRCRDPQFIEGSGPYFADNFDLTFSGAAAMRGHAVSPEGIVGGPAEFTRR